MNATQVRQAQDQAEQTRDSIIRECFEKQFGVLFCDELIEQQLSWHAHGTEKEIKLTLGYDFYQHSTFTFGDIIRNECFSLPWYGILLMKFFQASESYTLKKFGRQTKFCEQIDLGYLISFSVRKCNIDQILRESKVLQAFAEKWQNKGYSVKKTINDSIIPLELIISWDNVNTLDLRKAPIV